MNEGIRHALMHWNYVWNKMLHDEDEWVIKYKAPFAKTDLLKRRYIGKVDDFQYILSFAPFNTALVAIDYNPEKKVYRVEWFAPDLQSDWIHQDELQPYV